MSKVPHISSSSSSWSSSSSIISCPKIAYEVFLSFRGEDVRTTFADHLYHALISVGVHTFRDSEELQKGNQIEEELLTAIQQSKISIPIFSENYASSKWCLKELTHICECRRTLNQIVMPIFYKVEPRDVRGQKGKYEEAFEQINMVSEVQKWKDAMKEIGKLGGWHVKHETFEGDLIKEIVKGVCDKLNKRPFNKDNSLVAVESHIREVLKLLDIESTDRKIIGIHGLGGIGKTTIAKALCNEIFCHFEGCSFIANVREASQQHNGLVVLQNQLLRDTLKYEGRDITTVDAGTHVIQQRLCSKKVLIVLDDVDKEDQVECFVGDRKWFGVGSKIIITTRNKHILDCCRSDENYEPPPMELNDSLQLFSHHAFKRHQPPNDYLDLSKDMVETTGRLPLALRVIGSSLYLKGKPMWEDMLKKLQKVPNNDIMERLRISFDGLDDDEKQMFLDIACVFIGMYKDLVCYIWEGCGFHPLVGLDSLCKKSLVTICEKGKLGMHDLLRDLGRSIVYQENAEPGRRTRIWSQEDVLEVLHTQAGTSNVKGLKVDFRNISEDEDLKDEDLRSEGFVGMTRLRLLQIDYANFSWNFTLPFSELRWLSWQGCSNQFTQTNFCPRKLVVLDLSWSNITADWKGWSCIKMATKLKVLDLSYCRQLSKTPDLSKNQILEVLRLDGCDKLVEIHTSICCLTKLVTLKIGGWHTRLKDVPSQINKLTNLRELSLPGSAMAKFAENLDCMTSLVDLQIYSWHEQSTMVDLSVKISQITAMKSLKLYGTSLTNISSLPPSLTSLYINGCKGLRSISGLPSSLTMLRLVNSNSVVRVSNTSRDLRNLKTLHLDDCSHLEEIEGFDDKLDSLEYCSISSCKSLRKLPKLRGSKSLRTLLVFENDSISDFEGEGLDSLEVLEIEFCKSLRRIPYLQDSKRLRKLRIAGCPQLLKIEGLGDYESLQELDIYNCPCCWMEGLLNLSNLQKLRNLDIKKLDNLTEISGLDRLGSLRRLSIEECKNLLEINGINGLKNLEELKIHGCKALEKLQPDLSNAKKLKRLSIEGFENLDEIEELNISCCEISEHLEIRTFSHLKRLPDVSLFKKLGYLRIKDCNDLTEIHGVDRLESLNTLHISGCESLKSLLDVSLFKKLGYLRIEGCNDLTEIHGVDRLESLSELLINSCESLESLPDLSNLKRLKKLHVGGCKILSEIHGVDELESLSELLINSCESLESLPDLSNLKRLEKLHVGGCKILSEIHGVDRLESLSDLQISSCESLKRLPDLSKWRKLQWLRIRGCKILTEIRVDDRLESLFDLHIMYSPFSKSLGSLQSSTDQSKFKRLNWQRRKTLTEIDGDNEIHGDDGLESFSLHINGFESLKSLTDLSKLEWLKRLHIKGSRIQLHGPEGYYHLYMQSRSKVERLKQLRGIKDCKILDLSNLERLEELHIEGCKILSEIHGVDGLESLLNLHVSGCESLKSLLDLSNLKRLEKLHIEGYKTLSKIHGVEGLESLLNLHISGCESLERLPDLSNLKRLEGLHIEGYKTLSEIQGFDTLRSLTDLEIVECESLTRLPDLSILERLESLNIRNCRNLTEIQGFDTLRSLTDLEIVECESLTRLPDLSILERLESLNIRNCRNLTEIQGFDTLKSLTDLEIVGCESLGISLDLSKLKELMVLSIDRCKCLTTIQSVDTLESLNIIGNDSLEIFPDLSNMKKLTELGIEGYKNLTEIGGVDTLESLTYLSIIGCESLEISPDLSKLKNLETLIAKDCRKLTTIQAGNNPLGSLEVLDVRGCISLEELPDCVKLDKLWILNGVYCMGLTDNDRIKVLIDGGCSKFHLS